MSKENFEAKKVVLEAIPESEIKSPRKKIEEILQEDQDLYHWSLNDEEALVKVGLDWKLVTDLPVRIGTLRYAESIWLDESKTKEEAKVAWDEKRPEAKALRDTLLRYFRFAYHKDPELLVKVKKISEGSSQADMIQDLSDLSVLGKAHPEPLTKAGMDLGLLDKAAVLAEESAKLLGISHSVVSGRNEHCITRDRAFTHLKEAVDEIRRVGQFVFWDNEKRREGYLRKSDKKRKRNNSNDEDNSLKTSEE